MWRALGLLFCLPQCHACLSSFSWWKYYYFHDSFHRITVRTNMLMDIEVPLQIVRVNRVIRSYKECYNYFNMEKHRNREKAKTWNETMRERNYKEKIKEEGVFTLEEIKQVTFIFCLWLYRNTMTRTLIRNTHSLKSRQETDCPASFHVFSSFLSFKT